MQYLIRSGLLQILVQLR